VCVWERGWKGRREGGFEKENVRERENEIKSSQWKLPFFVGLFCRFFCRSLLWENVRERENDIQRK